MIILLITLIKLQKKNHWCSKRSSSHSEVWLITAQLSHYKWDLQQVKSVPSGLCTCPSTSNAYTHTHSSSGANWNRKCRQKINFSLYFLSLFLVTLRQLRGITCIISFHWNPSSLFVLSLYRILWIVHLKQCKRK